VFISSSDLRSSSVSWILFWRVLLKSENSSARSTPLRTELILVSSSWFRLSMICRLNGWSD